MVYKFCQNILWAVNLHSRSRFKAAWQFW